MSFPSEPKNRSEAVPKWNQMSFSSGPIIKSRCLRKTTVTKKSGIVPYFCTLPAFKQLWLNNFLLFRSNSQVSNRFWERDCESHLLFHLFRHQIFQALDETFLLLTSHHCLFRLYSLSTQGASSVKTSSAGFPWLKIKKVNKKEKSGLNVLVRKYLCLLLQWI